MSNYSQSLIEDYKQTIERLQKECTEKTNAIIALGEQLKAKEQECEALKKRNEDNERFYLIQYAKKDSEVLDLTHKLNVLEERKRADKLSKTLIEIKEIAENMNKECFYDDFDCKDCDMQNGCTYFNNKQILQKISEYEVNND